MQIGARKHKQRGNLQDSYSLKSWKQELYPLNKTFFMSLSFFWGGGGGGGMRLTNLEAFQWCFVMKLYPPQTITFLRKTKLIFDLW
jgi:hypothetical protein